MQRPCSCASPRGRSLAPAQRRAAVPAIGNQALQRLMLGRTVQAKLAVSEPDDELEREADETAESVMRMADPAAPARRRNATSGAIQRQCAGCGTGVHAAGAKCAVCAAEDRAVQRKRAANGAGPAASTVVPGTGTPLAHAARAFFEPRFQRDFGDVRVHVDRNAAAAAQSLDALAYTAGHDIVFGEGQYAPGTTAGRRLLAHELTHVVQQTGSDPLGIHRKVVDNDFHVPCRDSRAGAVDRLRKDEAEGIRICRAAAARIQANIAGVDPDPAGFAAALLRRFHLDANDPGVRTHWLPLLAKRYRIVANAIEQQNHRYNCGQEGVEPSVDCRTRPGFAFTAPGLGDTALCDNYWPESDVFRGGVIAHEWFHMIFEWFGDCDVTNTDSAECYEMFAREMGGTAGSTTLIGCCRPPAVLNIPASASAARIGQLAGGQVQRKYAACEGAAQAGKPKCSACEADDRKIQPKPAGAGAPPGTSPALPVLGTGAPLAADVRAFFEPRFQRDFGGVRVHTGTQAAASAHSLNALAYTRGSDVVFGEGQYAPGTSAGRRLLAHELAHVVQQSDEPQARQRIHRQPQEEEELPDAPPEVEPLPPIEPPGPEPEFECKLEILKGEFECCAPVPGIGRVCAPDPFTLKRKIEEALRKMGKKKPGRVPGGFPICPPSRQIPSPAPPPFRAGGCCPEGTFWSGSRCSRIPITPSCTPEQCREDEIFIGIPPCCIPREKKEPPPPPPDKKRERVSASHEVLFQFDRPASDKTGSAEFDRALTSEGKSNFATLVEQLRDDSTLKVQLIGSASPEGPEQYNFDLARRRALAVADALERAGIDRSRIVDPPEDDLRSDCKPIGTGLRSCGEIGGTGERDRRVLARVFDAR